MRNGNLSVYNGTGEVIGLRYEVINKGVPIGIVIGMTITIATTIGFAWGYAFNKLHEQNDTEFDAVE
jgi:hypothetical protein|nr:MAG TPA: hypothetical protein [Caudoviricetes sp.]